MDAHRLAGAPIDEIRVTSLQKVLRETYRSAYVARQDAMEDVARALYALERARGKADRAQSWLEKVGAELRASGYDKADDYIERLLPMAKPDEWVFNPNAAVCG